MEDSDQPDGARYILIEKIRRDTLDLVPEFYKLRLSFGGHRALGTVKLIHSRAAHLAVDHLSLGVGHCEFERHPFGVIAYDLAALQRH